MLRKLLTGWGSSCSWAPLLLRLPLGATFILHGWQKLSAEGGPAGMMAKSLGPDGLGLPAPEAMAWMAALGEFLGGLSVLTGTLTFVGGFLISCTMLVAILGVHWKNGYSGKGGWEWQALLLTTSVFLMIYGAGCLSVDAFLFKKKDKEAA